MAYDIDLTLSSRWSLCIYEIIMKLVHSYGLSRLHVELKAGSDRSGFGMIQVSFILELGQKLISKTVPLPFALGWIKFIFYFSDIADFFLARLGQ